MALCRSAQRLTELPFIATVYVTVIGLRVMRSPTLTEVWVLS